MICQRTMNEKAVKYSHHSFLILELEKRFVISSDAKTGIVMHEAINLSQVNKSVFLTVKK
jgi:hypothetical protein